MEPSKVEVRRDIADGIGEHQVGLTLQCPRALRLMFGTRDCGKELSMRIRDGDVARGVLRISRPDSRSDPALGPRTIAPKQEPNLLSQTRADELRMHV
jgi:hypothetical protein